MKKTIFLLLILAFVLGGCNKTEPVITEENPPVPIEEEVVSNEPNVEQEVTPSVKNIASVSNGIKAISIDGTGGNNNILNSWSLWKLDESLRPIWCMWGSFQYCVNIFKNDTDFYYGSNDGKDIKIEWIDINTLELINYPNHTPALTLYIKDKNNVYFGEEFKKLSTKDPKNIKILWCPMQFWWGISCYISDWENIFNNDFLMDWVDIHTFELLWDTDYSKDKNNVYTLNWETFTPEKIVNGDPNTFTLLWWYGYMRYAKDNNNIYFWTKIIPNTDLESFQYIWQEDTFVFTAKDKNHTYSNGKIVK